MPDMELELNEQTMPVVRMIGSQMPGGFFIYRAGGAEELLYANKEVFDIFGCDGLEDFARLTGFTFRGMLHPEDYAAITASIDEQIAVSGDQMDYVEYRIIRKDGAVRWVDDYGHYSETTAYGGVYYVFISDITEKREQREQAVLQARQLEEEQRRTQQEKLITALSSDYRGVYYIELDKDEGVCYQIHSGLEHGFRAGEHFSFLRGLTDYADAYVTEKYRDEFLRFIQPDAIRAVLRSERVISYRYMVVRNGRKSYEAVRFAGVRHPEDRDDNYVHAVSMCFMDVDSEMRHTLEQSRALSDALARAEDASAAKTAFLSNMSHEIRTPITGILGMNEMIRRESISEDVLGYSENIHKAGVSLLGIINDILDFSKIESGKMELVEADYDLAVLIRDVVNLMRLRAEEKGLVFQVDVDGTLPALLRGDEIRVKQILTNLLSNAVKYTERGSVHMRFAMLSEDETSVRMRVSVTDTGIGIREEDLGKLFTAFERLDQIRTRKILGTGLGLPITQKMLSLMGSELEVESVYGSGSTFSFTLRQDVCGRKRIGSFELPVSDSGTLKRGRTPFVAPEARILVVDDTPMNIQVISGLLKRTKMRIDTAQSGMAGIERFAADDYDLVFLDYRMPVMDGIETLGRLKERYPEKVARTPIICLTASAVSGTREYMIEAGFTDYLSKPVDIEKMENTLIRYLPREKITLTEETQEDPLAFLPEEVFAIPQLDPAAGISFCGDAEAYLDALRSFKSSIESRSGQLEECLASMDIAGYTLKVHSLKSTAHAVGAIEVSNRARALEDAGNRGDVDTVRRDTPLLLEAYRSLREPLERLFRERDGAAAKPPVSEQEFDDAVAAIHELCELYDDSSIQDILNELEGHAVPDSRETLYRELCEAARCVDWETLSALSGTK